MNEEQEHSSQGFILKKLCLWPNLAKLPKVRPGFRCCRQTSRVKLTDRRIQATENGRAIKQYNTDDGDVLLESSRGKLKIESATAADDDISSKQRGQINRIYCLASSRSPVKLGQHPYTPFRNPWQRPTHFYNASAVTVVSGQTADYPHAFHPPCLLLCTPFS